MCFPLSPPGLRGGDLIPLTAENLRLRCKIRQDPPIQAVGPGGELESGLLTEVLIFSPRGLNQILSKGPTAAVWKTSGSFPSKALGLRHGPGTVLGSRDVAERDR